MKHKLFLMVILMSVTMEYTYAQKESKPEWAHFYIDAILPGSSWGTGGGVLADFDGDGDLDAALSRRVTRQAYWYERVNDSIWIPHVIALSDNLANTLGSVAIDLDQDGWMDVVSEGVWFRNPGTLAKSPDTPWKAVPYKGGGHDITKSDIDGDGVEDLVIYDGNKLAWYKVISKNQAYSGLWENIIGHGYQDHGGTAPKGIGDLDGDGDSDVVIPGYWFENPGNGQGNWTRHEWPYQPVPDASYGRSIRSWIADINQDGINDIVYSDCDTGGSHVYWVENKDRGKTWVSHRLPDPLTKDGDVPGTGSFHSLGVADFDQDGNPDIFAGEQEDASTFMEQQGRVAMKPRGLKERGVIWYNKGGKTLEFEIYMIHVDNPGWHDAQLGDVDGDGDIDIVTKVWNADGPVYHLGYWRNELK
ncbi:MAG: FG-GAP repeat domain-containing protein [Mangrovibacterium sp.]